MDSVLHGDKAKAGGSRLAAELDGQWAADGILGGNPHPFTAVVGHSYGTTVVGKAVSDLTHAVQSVVFVASAGVEGGFGSGMELKVEGGMGHVYASQSSQDVVADRGRFGSGRVDPRDYRYGAQVYSSDGDIAAGLQATDGHETLGYGSDNGNPVFPHATRATATSAKAPNLSTTQPLPLSARTGSSTTAPPPTFRRSDIGRCAS
jgi:pimeloyl-ACP methyl ester carboxylesterase